MAQKIYGLDIGSGNYKMCFGDKILNEKNVIATTKKEVCAIGDQAYEMFEKAPAGIEVSFPVSSGVIADIENMQSLFYGFFKKINGGKKPAGACDFYIAVPTDVTEVEKRAFYELVVRAKIKMRNVLVVDKPVADAVGAGLDVTQNKGIMVVNIGADTCEISVLSAGGIVISRSVKTGGSKMDDNIIQAVRKEYNLLIGKKTAEKLKIELGSAVPKVEEKFPAFGRNVLSGLPVSCNISSRVICSAIADPLFTIMDKMRAILEQTPPELSEDIIGNGIFLTGGCAGIKGLKDAFKSETELNVNVVDNPQESIVRGLNHITRVPQLERLAYVPEDRVLD